MRNKKPLIGLILLIASLVAFLWLGLRFSAIAGAIDQNTASWWQYLPLVLRQYSSTQTPTPVVPTPVGPVGGTFTSLAVDPNQNDNIYAGHFGSGVYKSFDQGNTWYAKSNGLGNRTIQSLAAHPTNTDIVYAGTYGGGVYKSISAGESWFASNGGVLRNHIIYDIEIDPTNTNRIYVTTRIGGNHAGYVYKSTNAGASWSLLIKGNFYNSPDYFYDIEIDPFNSNVLYLSSHEHGFYKSTNAGQSFYEINYGVTDLSARSMTTDTAHSGLVYGGVWHGSGIYRSWTGGSGWTQNSYGLPIDVRIMDTYVDPFGRMQKRVFSCTYGNGLYSSDDFAQNWVSRGLTGQRIYDLLITDGNPQRWYAATETNGIFRSNTYGANWNTIMADLNLNAITSLAGDGSHQYAAVFGKGVYQLEQGGFSWSEIVPPLEDKMVLDLAIVDDSVIILTDTGLYLQSGEGFLRLDFPTSNSVPDLETSTQLSEKVGVPPEMLQMRMNLSENQEPEHGFFVTPHKLEVFDSKIYLLTLDDGLYLRVDDGWEQVGFAGMNAAALGWDEKGGSMLASVCGQGDSCMAFYHAGDEWLPADQGLDGSRINDFLFTGGDLIAAAETGIFVWEGDSQTWVRAYLSSEPMLSLTQSDCNLAAGGVGMLIYSSDCGKTWEQVTLGDPWHYQALVFVSGKPGRLILGTREIGASLIDVK